MRKRDAVLVYQETQSSDASTKTIDLDIVDPVSAIYLEFDATNSTDDNEDNFISDIITKVEIVDGSEVLYSLPYDMLEALHFYKLKTVPTMFPSEWIGGHQRHGCLLMFGRHLWDPEFAMDFTRFKNPQLKITWNLAAIRAVGTTGFATGTLTITVIAKIMEDTPAPAHYLMAKELLSFTSSSTSSAEERKELPTDYPYRLLMTRHWVEGSDVDEVSSDLKLTCDADRYIQLDRKVKQLDAEALAEFGPILYKHDVHRSGSCTIRVIPNKEPHSTFYPQDPGQPKMIVLWAQWSSNVNLELYSHDGTLDSTDRDLTGWVMGHAIHATVPLPMGDMAKPETWFDPTLYKKVELVFTSGGTAGTCEVVLEQVRPL